MQNCVEVHYSSPLILLVQVRVICKRSRQLRFIWSEWHCVRSNIWFSLWCCLLYPWSSWHSRWCIWFDWHYIIQISSASFSLNAWLLSSCFWTRCSRSTALLWEMIVQNILLLISHICLSPDFLIKLLEILFSESVVWEKLPNFIVDIMFCLIPVFEFEFVNQHAFELFPLLDA